MESEHLAVHLFRICLSAYAVGAAASFALTRFPRMASLTGFSGACDRRAGRMSWLSLTGLTQGASPALDALASRNAVRPFFGSARSLGGFLHSGDFAAGAGHIHLFLRLRHASTSVSRMWGVWRDSSTCYCSPRRSSFALITPFSCSLPGS